MFREFVMRNKVAVAFVLGALYLGAYVTLVALLDAQDDENDRMSALRWQNNKLIEKLAAQADLDRYSSNAVPPSASENGGPR